MNYINSSPDTATSESCSGGSSSSCSITSSNNNINNFLNNFYEDIDNEKLLTKTIEFNNNNKNEISENKKAPIDYNFINDNRIFQNLLKIEDCYCIQSNYFMYVQPEIKPWMRNVLANWMLEVCENQNCSEDVFVLAMNLLDRFLCIQPISKRYLQLLGTVCMFIASKLRSSVGLNAETLVIYTDRSIELEELLNWEQLVLQKLHWDICSVTPNDFVPHLLAKLTFLDNYSIKLILQHLSSFISLCSTDFRFSILTPSMIASGCLLNVINLLFSNDEINYKTMQVLNEVTFIEIDCLNECREQIEELIESCLQMRPELAEKINITKCQSRNYRKIVNCNQIVNNCELTTTC